MTVETLNFNPQQNYPISASTTSTPQAITQPSNTAPGQNPLTNIMIKNNTSSVAYVAWTGTGTATATVNGLNSVPVLAGEIDVFSMGMSAASVAVVLGTGAGTVYVSIGQGS